jgi:hypothetical protein
MTNFETLKIDADKIKADIAAVEASEKKEVTVDTKTIEVKPV